MGQNEELKIYKESYKFKAIKRINEIEKELTNFFSSIKSSILAYPTNEFSGLIKSYLKWTKECLDRKKSLKELMDRPNQSQLQKKKCRNAELKFITYFENGISYYTKAIKNSQKMMLMSNCICSSPERELYITPNKIDGLMPSELLVCFINIYYQYLDPDELWLTAPVLENIFRKKEPSLLKSILMQSILSLIELPKEYEQILLNSTKNIQNMMAQSYNDPTLDDVIAIILISGEYLYTNNYSLASIYLGQAIRMGQMLQILPEERENTDSFTKNKFEDSLKDKLWELIVIFYISLSYLPGYPLILKYSRVTPLSHVRDKTISLPTMPRLGINKIKKIDLKDMLKSINTSTMVPNINNTKSFELSYYSRAIACYFHVLQSYLNERNMLKKNPNIYPIDRFYFDVNSILKMIGELDKDINNVSINYKSFRFLSSKQLANIKSYGVLQSDDTSSLGSSGYFMFLNTKLYIIDPLSYISPCSHSLLYSWLWTIGLETADKLWDLFSTLFNRNNIDDECPWIVFNTSFDLLPTVYFYLNALSQLHFVEGQNEIIYSKVQQLVYWIKKDRDETHYFEDSGYAIEVIEKDLEKFHFLEKYSIVI
ncbi:hypothetical protein K502DRAFT_325629 [Neoconidiobolus thromboides FSU 785]|nr:hypothetical protein K502DRAFT_325629 [Neoconidiobolus thromboides FSU 785]